MTHVEPGQVYVECGLRDSRSPRRVKVKAVFPYGSDWVPAGMAFIASLFDDGREMRLRAIKLGKLHRDPRTQYGQPRRQGYLLETVYPETVFLTGLGAHTHLARPIPSNAFQDSYETACGCRGRLNTKILPSDRVTCAACVGLTEEMLG